MRTVRAPHLGALEAVIAAYAFWNVFSALLPHEFEAVDAWRFIVTGTPLPILLYIAGRSLFDREDAVQGGAVDDRRLHGLPGQVTAVIQFYGPEALVWPRFIVDDPGWPGRAVGIFNQPVTNGLVLVLGFVVALFLATRPDTKPAVRLGLYGTALVAAAGVYLTYTRSAWLSLAIAVAAGAVLARGWRKPFVISLLIGVAGVAATFRRLVSDDRSAGGVGSSNEVYDRLNIMATSFKAILDHPIFGVGIGRFTKFNTDHHVAWSQEIDWNRGWSIASHENELGITAELGLPGGLLWIALLVGIAWKLVSAYRRLPPSGLLGQGFAVSRAPDPDHMAGHRVHRRHALPRLRRHVAVPPVRDRGRGPRPRLAAAHPGSGGRGRPKCRSRAAVPPSRAWHAARIVRNTSTPARRPGRHGGVGRRHPPMSEGRRTRPARVLWVSTSLATQGGISAAVRTLAATPLWERWGVRHVASHQDGSPLVKVLRFAACLAQVLVELVVRRPDLVHLHTSSDGSFVRKAAILWLARAAGVPVVLHVHSGRFHDFHRGVPAPMRALIRRTLAAADVVVALDEPWVERLRVIAPTARFVNVPNAVPTAGRRTGAGGRSAPRRLPRPHLGEEGRFHPRRVVGRSDGDHRRRHARGRPTHDGRRRRPRPGPRARGPARGRWHGHGPRLAAEVRGRGPPRLRRRPRPAFPRRGSTHDRTGGDGPRSRRGRERRGRHPRIGRRRP